MKKPSDPGILRDKIIGLGEKSIRKSYYPELQQRISELEVANLKLQDEIKTREQMTANQKKLEEQLHAVQKLESLGTLAGGVAHDFNNMLNVILGQAEFALEKLPDQSPLRDNLLEILHAARRSSDLTRQLLAFARRQPIAPQKIDLNATIQSMLKMLGRLIGEGIELLWHPQPQLGSVCLDPSQIDQLLANLVVNARDAIGNKNGKVTIETSNQELNANYCESRPGCHPGKYICLAVSDNGSGIHPEVLARLYEPFFTTKEPGRGTVLGLATVYGIVKQNDGFIEVITEQGIGTTFMIFLPQSEGRPQAAEDREKCSLPAQTGNSETILLVEDEPSIIQIASMMLERWGYQILAASTPDAAIELARQHQGEIHLLISDVILPGMNGRELANRLIALHPDMKCMFMSGYTSDIIDSHGVFDTGVFFIQKPFNMEDLTSKVRQALDSGKPEMVNCEETK